MGGKHEVRRPMDLSGKSVVVTGGNSGIGVYSSALGEVPVYDTPDGNDQGGSPKLLSGTTVGQWNNYAVLFDRAAGTLAIYVNLKLLKQLDPSRPDAALTAPSRVEG